ncbi:RnfH family protein [Pseudomonas sp.]|uniref:RnfH family protein n=1 Tax=Pseudomonas sp. TaxID=306 RepID=UPI0028AC3008|nr:RnfH family protein [Pseudomonas sp.]
MADAMIRVELAYAEADRQVLLALDVPRGSTVREVAVASGLQAQFPQLDLSESPLGIFGKLIADPQRRVLEEGDRVEIYRALLADPKEVRKQRAERARLREQGESQA